MIDPKLVRVVVLHAWSALSTGAGSGVLGLGFVYGGGAQAGMPPGARVATVETAKSPGPGSREPGLLGARGGVLLRVLLRSTRVLVFVVTHVEGSDASVHAIQGNLVAIRIGEPKSLVER